MFSIHFAPLQGYTEDIYRRSHHRICGGVARYYTPFIRTEHGEVRRKDLFDMMPAHNEGVPLALQVIAADAGEFCTVLRSIDEQWLATDEQRQAAITTPLHIDLNMGCPFPLQVRHGRGAGLLLQPERVKEICAVMAERPDLRFSVKMRLGVDDRDDWRAIMPILNDTPLEHITLHPRIAAQQYGGDMDMQSFEDVLRVVKHPLVYNGDLVTIQQIATLENTYPSLHGVMIGRGLLARPTLAQEYATGTTLTDAEVIRALLQLHDAFHENYARRIPGEAQLLNKIRTFWDYTEPTLGRKAWKKVHKAGSMRNYLAAVGEMIK